MSKLEKERLHAKGDVDRQIRMMIQNSLRNTKEAHNYLKVLLDTHNGREQIDMLVFKLGLEFKEIHKELVQDFAQAVGDARYWMEVAEEAQAKLREVGHDRQA